MKESKNTKQKINLWGVVISASIISTLGLYLFVFGSFTFSRDIDDWAGFGTYAGGILGPIFSLFAFIYIVRTFKLQQEQITEIRKQSEIAAIQIMIHKSLNAIDDIFMSISTVETGLNSTPFSVKLGPLLERIDGLFHQMAASSTDSERDLNNEKMASLQTGVKFDDAYILINELTSLCDLYDDFKNAGGSERLLERYIERHYDFSNGLHRVYFLQKMAAGMTRYYPPTAVKK